MTLLLSKYYVENTFKEDNKNEIKIMIENIKNTMINRINEIEWLDESTREYAIEKVLKMKYLIGYVDILMNVENLYNKYKPLKDLKNNDSLTLLITTMNIKKNLIYDSELMYYSMLKTYIINCDYKSLSNTMNFPSGILQSPVFDKNRPDYINYGVIGSLIGHELTHAFDNNGKMYDVNGIENNWWTENDDDEYNEFSQCFINQYGNYSSEINGKKYYVDGKNTINENIADNGGLSRTYEAWKLSIKNNPEEAKKRNMKLPGLSDYTLDQLFFISYGQLYCSINDDDKIFKDVHSPGRFRVNGVISNNKEFAKIFNCPTKSPMNPNNKCVLW
ncbi:zincin [Anaeromyces robustus]|uniref:Zincin n=1 Tax=Anaeromyces robustus TaxID=1754192 RepID=A0A1Y1VWC9_9FUNG|nr:zincin [Anaeromyces robustus]|eukprot:ORX65591.1 zincin [Anaeromyces robustus]